MIVVMLLMSVPSTFAGERVLLCKDWSAWRQGYSDADMDTFGLLMIGNLQGVEAFAMFLKVEMARLLGGDLWTPPTKRNVRELEADVDRACVRKQIVN